MSVSKAIWIGLLVVNGPVLLLLFGPLSVIWYLLVLAWPWWAIAVPS